MKQLSPANSVILVQYIRSDKNCLLVAFIIPEQKQGEGFFSHSNIMYLREAKISKIDTPLIETLSFNINTRFNPCRYHLAY